MKRNSPEKLPQKGGQKKVSTDPLNQGDALWNILGEASETKTNAFFARNTVRQARILGETEPNLLDRFRSMFFTPKTILPLAGAACLGIVALTQFSPDQSANTPDTVKVETTTAETSMALAELVIEESLTAAAEDPSQFTHDEVVAMIGL